MLSYILKRMRKTVCNLSVPRLSVLLLLSWGTKMSKVAHMGSAEGKITVAIKETVDFERNRLSGCSLHHQKVVDGIVFRITGIAVPWWCK